MARVAYDSREERMEVEEVKEINEVNEGGTPHFFVRVESKGL